MVTAPVTSPCCACWTRLVLPIRACVSRASLAHAHAFQRVRRECFIGQLPGIQGFLILHVCVCVCHRGHRLHMYETIKWSRAAKPLTYV